MLIYIFMYNLILSNNDLFRNSNPIRNVSIFSISMNEIENTSQTWRFFQIANFDRFFIFFLKNFNWFEIKLNDFFHPVEVHFI